jgi:prepilin-type N-terminal cleavage/methylation domain-containing protein
LASVRILDRLRRRLVQEERGFTLIELLIVVIILGILTTLGLPTYLSFQDKARKSAAAARIRSAVVAINSYALNNYPSAPTAYDPDWNGTDAAGTGTNADNGYADTNTTYGFFQLLHNKYDTNLPTTGWTWDHNYTPTSATDYCLYTNVGVWYAAKRGPAGTVTVGKQMVENTCTAQ